MGEECVFGSFSFFLAAPARHPPAPNPRGRSFLNLGSDSDLTLARNLDIFFYLRRPV